MIIVGVGLKPDIKMSPHDFRKKRHTLLIADGGVQKIIPIKTTGTPNPPPKKQKNKQKQNQSDQGKKT